MTSEKKVCGSCNAIDDSDAEFCRECGTALPPLPTDSSELLAQAKIALARADYKGVLRACAAAKLLDPNNAKVSQIMAAAHAALDVLRDQKPGEGNAAHVQDSNSHLDVSDPLSDEPDEQDDSERKYSRRQTFCILVLMLMGLLAVIVIGYIVVTEARKGPLIEIELGGSDEVSNSDGQSRTGGTTSQSSVPVYEGCDGLEDLIPKFKSIGGSSLGYYQIVQFGDNAMCDDTIAKLNKPELLKD